MGFDSQYTIQMRINDFTFYGYKKRTNIKYNNSAGSWDIKVLSDSNKHASTNGHLPPLGTQDYTLSEDLGGGHIRLDINACDDRKQFNCQDGSCIPIEKRCNSEFDCKDGDDESECNLIDVPISYLSFVPGNSCSTFIFNNDEIYKFFYEYSTENRVTHALCLRKILEELCVPAKPCMQGLMREHSNLPNPL